MAGAGEEIKKRCLRLKKKKLAPKATGSVGRIGAVRDQNLRGYNVVSLADEAYLPVFMKAGVRDQGVQIII